MSSKVSITRLSSPYVILLPQYDLKKEKKESHQKKKFIQVQESDIHPAFYWQSISHVPAAKRRCSQSPAPPSQSKQWRVVLGPGRNKETMGTYIKNPEKVCVQQHLLFTAFGNSWSTLNDSKLPSLLLSAGQARIPSCVGVISMDHSSPIFLKDLGQTLLFTFPGPRPSCPQSLALSTNAQEPDTFNKSSVGQLNFLQSLFEV